MSTEVICGGVDAVRASAAYAPMVDLRILKDAPVFARPTINHFRKVTVEARNGGERAIEELEVQVYFLDPRGRPHRVEVDGASPPGRPNYTWAYPVIAGTRPLGPGETRVFDVDVPETSDSPAAVKFDAFGAQVTWVRF